MYAASTSKPLISVGQLKAMLDLRFVWDDVLLFCSSGQKYVLMRAKVFHHVPITSQKELKPLVTAIEDFCGGYHEWQSFLERDFEIYGNSIHQDHPQTIEEEAGEIWKSKMPVRVRAQKSTMPRRA